MTKNLATLITALAIGAASIACSPAAQNTLPYSPNPEAQLQSAEPSLYCYFQGLINDKGRLTTAAIVINEPNPQQKWDELLCKENEEPPYLVGIMLPNTWDGMKLSMDGIVKDVSDYQQQNSEKWKRLEVWMGRKGEVFAGFLVVSYEKPPLFLGDSITTIPAYNQLAEDLFGIVGKYATPKPDKGITL